MDLEPALAAYRRDGIARLGRVIDPAFLASLRERSDDLMLGRLRIDGLFFQHDSATGRYEDVPYGRGYEGPSTRYRKLEKLERDDRFRALLENPLFERIARALIGPSVSIYRAVMFNKAPRDGSPLPWHQDAGRFWGLDRDPRRPPRRGRCLGVAGSGRSRRGPIHGPIGPNNSHNQLFPRQHGR